MNAILVTIWENLHPSSPQDTYLASLLRLIDRPFVQHIVEYLIAQGVDTFHFVLCQFPEKFKALLGDGTRWGVTFHYHLVKDPSRPYRPLKLMAGDETPVLLIHTDTLPVVDVAGLRPSTRQSPAILYCAEADPLHLPHDFQQWTGWAWLSSQCRLAVPDEVDKSGLYHFLISSCSGKTVPVPRALDVKTYAGLLSAHQAVLGKTFSGLELTGKEIENDIWLSRNINLHPTAKLVPPVYIDQDCKIGAGVRMGPYATIGNNSVIDNNSSIEDSVIFPGSYIGENLELKDTIVDKNRLINTRIESEAIITEDFILGSMSEKHISEWLGQTLSRCIASLFFLLGLPVLIVIFLYLKVIRKGPALYKQKVVRLPAPAEKRLWQTLELFSFQHPTKVPGLLPCAGWRDFFLRFLPGLINIVLGRIRFIGVSPRSPKTVEVLPEDWKSLYLKSKAGLITEAMVHFGTDPSEDELYAADAFYAVSAGIWYDLKILTKYMAQVLGIQPKPAKPEPK
jgi:lipopolysaccharide/colanic/teichoic acid biosynthesis glycosyltransferase